MLKFGAWLVWPLLLLPHGPLAAQVLPDPGEDPVVDTITPVPAPEIPIGATADLEPAIPEEIQIDNFGGGTIEFITDVSLRFAGPGVKLTADTGAEVFSDRAFVDLKTKTATLEGNVSVYQGNTIQRGEKVLYHIETKQLDTSGLRASIDPVLLEAGKFTAERDGNQTIYTGTDAAITTHDVQNPNFWVRSKQTNIYPGDKIVFRDLRLFYRETPVFWLPYLSQQLDGELGYHMVPGSRSNWGPFLLNTYGIMLGGEKDPVTGDNRDAWLLSRWHLDLRAERGAGVGLDLLDIRSNTEDEISGLKLYYSYDLAPDTSRSGVPRLPIGENRYKLELKHRHPLDFPDDADWRVDANLTYLSDRYFLEDYEVRRYRTDPAPDNTLGIYRRSDSSLLSLYGRFRLNDFYRSDTRQPEIAFDQARGPLFGLPVLHEGSTSLGLIGERAPDITRNAVVNPLTKLRSGSPGARRLLGQLSGYERRLAESMLALPLNDPRRQAIRSQLLDSSYTRFRTYQELSLPTTIGGFLSLTPQAGFGYSNYSSVDGPSGNLDRTHLHFGIETSLKFAKELGKYQNHDWGLDGMMHVFQPYGAWSYISTDDFEPGDPAVDRLTPTTRPRPLDPARFPAIDEMNSWNVIRFGARNRLLTKRDGQTFEWLYLDTYMDAFIKDPEADRDFSNLYNDLQWRPLPWLRADLETQFPVTTGSSGFNEIGTRLRFLPADNFEFSVGYRWLTGHPILLDSSHLELDTYTRLSENWGIGTRHGMELDDNTLEFQQYTVHRDFGNWVAGVGVSLRDNRLENEYGAVFSLTLKEFPSLSLPFEIAAE